MCLSITTDLTDGADDVGLDRVCLFGRNQNSERYKLETGGPEAMEEIQGLAVQIL